MIHQYKLNGYNIVLDVHSGSVHAVDPLAYDVIALFENTAQDEIVRQMLEKYADDPDVDEGEVRSCIDDVAALKASRRSACTSPTPATSTANTASPARAATRASGR